VSLSSRGAPGALLVIVSGPSGVGKDTVIEAFQRLPDTADVFHVVTSTTRARRDGEVDGQSYDFLPEDVFAARREAGAFLEHAEVHGHWYGTPRASVADALASGRDVMLKIDVQGAAAVKDLVSDALLIFLVPPSLEELFERLVARATENIDELETRQRNAAIELARAGDYDYLVTNETGEVARTAERIEAIMRIEKRKHPTRRIEL
jgi:guanylate kinase